MTPDEQPTAREFGVLEGKVDALIQQSAKNEERNSAEHGAVMKSLERVETKLDSKVDWAWMREQQLPDRVNSLESFKDKGSGAAKLIEVGKGLAILALMVLTYLAAQGQAG